MDYYVIQTYRLSADSDRYYQQQELSSLPAPTKKTRHLSEGKQQPVSSLSRQVPPSSALPLALKDRRVSNPAGFTADDYPPQAFKGRKLPPTPTAVERPSTVRSRTESAPDPLPPPFQPKLAAPKDHHYANLVLNTPPESPVDYSHPHHQQINDSYSDDHRHSFGPSKRKGQLDPLIPRTYTNAREMSPGGVKESGNMRRNKAQIVPQSRNELMENGGTPTIGWGSNKNLVTSKRHSGSHQSVFGIGPKSDIQSLMDTPMNYQMQSVERLNTLGSTSPIHATGLAWSSGHNIKGLDFRQQETSPPPGQCSASPFHPKQKLLTSKDSPKLNNEVVRNELSPVEGPAQSFKRSRSTSAKARPHSVHVTQPLQGKATKSTKNLSLYNGDQIPNNYRKSEYYDYYNTSTEQLPEIDTRPGSGKVHTLNVYIVVLMCSCNVSSYLVVMSTTHQLFIASYEFVFMACNNIVIIMCLHKGSMCILINAHYVVINYCLLLQGKRTTTKGLSFGGFLGKALKISSFKGDISSKP